MAIRKKIKYFAQIVKWMFKHRDERDCRQKWRRMERELRRQKW